jgi:hypothetical protein
MAKARRPPKDPARIEAEKNHTCWLDGIVAVIYDTLLQLPALVVHRQQINTAGEETTREHEDLNVRIPSLGEPNDNPASEQSAKAVDESLANCRDTPYEHNE